MNPNQTGGPVLPVHIRLDDQWKALAGLTIRDHFAGLAMQGFITGVGVTSAGIVAIDDERIAERAFEVADAMMAERGTPSRSEVVAELVATVRQLMLAAPPGDLDSGLRLRVERAHERAIKAVGLAEAAGV